MGLPRLPLLGGEDVEWRPCPITASWYPEIRTRSTCGQRLLEGAEPVLGQKDERINSANHQKVRDQFCQPVKVDSR